MRGFIASLSDGSTLTEEDILTTLSQFIIEHKLETKSPWVVLKEYIKATGLKLFGVQLQFDHQGVFFPRHSKAYFYSKKVEAYLGGNQAQVLYYGVGASSRTPEEVEITWYDGENSTIEKRKVDADNPAFIVN